MSETPFVYDLRQLESIATAALIAELQRRGYVVTQDAGEVPFEWAPDEALYREIARRAKGPAYPSRPRLRPLPPEGE